MPLPRPVPLLLTLALCGACWDPPPPEPPDAGERDLGRDSVDAGFTVFDAGPSAATDAGPFLEIPVAVPAFLSDSAGEPLDEVMLTGAGSIPSSFGSAITAWAWAIEALPTGSTVVLTSPSDSLTGTAFGTAFGVDLAGTYLFSLRVWDDSGRVSERAFIEWSAIAVDALVVQLTWDDDEGNLNLHVVRSVAELCTESDCYASTCVGYGPDWDLDDAAQGGDPRLDIDDVDGFGPENISLSSPIDGDYHIAVHARDLAHPVNAITRVYDSGSLVWEGEYVIGPGERWDAAVVRFAEDSASVSSIGTVVENWQCE